MSNRGFPPNGGRGRGGFNNYPPMHPGASPQPYRSMPNQPRGPSMPPAFQPQMHPNSPYRGNRSPAITPAAIHQQANYAGYNYAQAPYPQPVRISSTVSTTSPVSESSKPASSTQASRTQLSSQSSSSCTAPAGVMTQPTLRLHHNSPSGNLFDPVDPPFSAQNITEQFLTEIHHAQQSMYGPPQGLDPYGNYYAQGYPNQYNGMPQAMHYPGVPASPGRTHGFPQQAYPVPGYGQPPQAQGMSRTPSNMSERPGSAAQQPSTPAMTNVSHVSQTPNTQSGSPAPSASFSIPSKAKSKAIVVSNAKDSSLHAPNTLQIKTADGKVVDFNKSGEKPASPAPPAPSKSPAIAATPTPPPRPDSTHSRGESVATKSAEEKKADFVKQFQESLRAGSQKDEEEKKKEEEAKLEAEKAQKAKEEAEAAAKAEADKAAKEKEAAEAAEADAAEAKRKEEEEMEREYWFNLDHFCMLTVSRHDRRDGARREGRGRA